MSELGDTVIRVGAPKPDGIGLTIRQHDEREFVLLIPDGEVDIYVGAWALADFLNAVIVPKAKS